VLLSMRTLVELARGVRRAVMSGKFALLTVQLL
jgi:hypothetical protein